MQREARGEWEVREMLETGVRKRGCWVMKYKISCYSIMIH